MAAAPKRIMVIIPKRLFRNGIEHVLRAAGGHVVYGCETLDDAEAALHAQPDLQPDLFVIGMNVPALVNDSLGRIRQLRNRVPNGRWIVLSSNCGGPEFWWRAVESRVDGVLHEDSPDEVLQLLVRLILLGYSFLPATLAVGPGGLPAEHPVPTPPALERSLHDVFAIPERQPGRNGRTGAAQWRTGLSQRESDILRGLVAGQSNKAIARDLNISEATVKVHVKALLRKMQVTNRTQAAISALQFLRNPATEPGQALMPAPDKDDDGLDDLS